MDGQSFSARRSAASNLPTFQLPPPDHLSGMHKYQTYGTPSNTHAPTVTSVLTPPGHPSDGLSPVASSSGSSNTGVPPYQPMTFWPQPQNPPFNYSSAPPMAAPFAHQNPQSQHAYGRPLYSPMHFPPNRNTQSPTASEGLPAPPYDQILPPFPTGMSSGGGPQQQLPQLAPQHQQQQMSHPQHAISQPPSQGSIHASDTYGGRPPPTPTYFNSTPVSTPQQSSFPAHVQQSPHSPYTSGPSRISPISAQNNPMSAPNAYHRPYPGQYNLPAMAGPVMSNVHSPGGQMSLIGGVNMQQYPSHHMGGQVYGHQQNQPQNDRPFRCDVCPQSFNRNHDLKRHKRIHLAVKPFPCNHCDKSFSRKDALKVCCITMIPWNHH